MIGKHPYAIHNEHLIFIYVKSLVGDLQQFEIDIMDEAMKEPSVEYRSKCYIKLYFVL